MRNSDCGIVNFFFDIPHSAISIPHLLLGPWNP